MDRLVIEGGNTLKGTINISGAKNAALPIMAAALLTDETCVINNVPALRDTDTMIRILRAMEAKVERKKECVSITGACGNLKAPYDLVSTMRASVCVLGPLVAKRKFAEVSFPGGCIIGPRPIDLHLKGLEKLGAEIKIKSGYIIAKAKKLKGAKIYLGGHFGSSVLATANTMMAATLAEGTTVIENAACEPEIVDLANFLISMGARIEGHSTPTVMINGVKKLHATNYKIISDRIETGTYALAGAITGGDIFLKGAKAAHLLAVIDKLRECGIHIVEHKDGLRVKRKVKSKIKPTSVTTLPYPGFPTDMQAQIMALLCLSDGISIITEKIYPERFIHVSELGRMGAQIILEGPNAIIKGVKSLSGADVMASDLRASAALVLAGLVAKQKTRVHRIYHLDRGYEKLDKKLKNVGASIWREKEEK
ncbi:MAG: UDP-N-acetylglucosamine 1-carboxyvinyltransferase [Candidatus Omnitrophica bacterium]|nr:UDP-N-acetylglucosamine 1-carboxyvinyltransferase [Candidatus Omnitrophota bacterium]